MSYKLHLSRLRNDNEIKGLDDYALVDDFFRYLLEETELLQSIDSITRINDIAQHYCGQGLEMGSEDEDEDITQQYHDENPNNTDIMTINNNNKTLVKKVSLGDIDKMAREQVISTKYLAKTVQEELLYVTPSSIDTGPMNEISLQEKNQETDNISKEITIPPTKQHGAIIDCTLTSNTFFPGYFWFQSITELTIKFYPSHLIFSFLSQLCPFITSQQPYIHNLTEQLSKLVKYTQFSPQILPLIDHLKGQVDQLDSSQSVTAALDYFIKSLVVHVEKTSSKPFSTIFSIILNAKRIFAEKRDDMVLFDAKFDGKVNQDTFVLETPEFNQLLSATNIITSVFNLLQSTPQAPLFTPPDTNPLFSVDILKEKSHIGWWAKCFVDQPIPIDVSKIDEPLNNLDELDESTKSLITSTIYTSFNNQMNQSKERKEKLAQLQRIQQINSNYDFTKVVEGDDDFKIKDDLNIFD